MPEINQYFDGQVVSIAYQGEHLATTVGVMQSGRYTFNTTQHETMSIIDGEVRVKFAQHTEFSRFSSGSQFQVEADSQFDIEVLRPSAYLCTYS